MEKGLPMIENMPEFTRFLVEAKIKTYAGKGQPAAASRPTSVDLPYEQGDYYYLDSYLGGFRFAGEEAVWHRRQPVWSMNYYGWMLVEHTPGGFADFHKRALLKIPPEAPYRGPAYYNEGEFEYRCEWKGGIDQFLGKEEVLLAGQLVYRLVFHGGTIQ
jgi:hypothetical protein